MVCAPSNAAIDQIILRIIDRGLIGLQGLKRPKPEKKKNAKEKKKLDESDSSEEFMEAPDLATSLIRITSAEYSTETAIKKYTLEQRIIKKLCIEKFGTLKKCIKELKEMIAQMADFDSWEEFPEFPYVNKVKFKNYTRNIKDAILKRCDNWGDINLSRQQQAELMNK